MTKRLWSLLSVLTLSFATAGAPVGAGVSVLHFCRGIKAEIRLNGEPVYLGQGSYSFAWSGYPLRNGTNVIAITMEREVPDSSKPVNSRMVLSLNSSNTNKVFAEEITDVLDTRITVSKSFVLDGSVDSSRSFEVLGSDFDTNEIRRCAKDLACAIAERDAREVAKLLATSTQEVTQEFGGKIFDTSRKASTRCIESLAELKVTSGKTLVLISAAELTATNNTSALVELAFENPKQEFRIKSFVFGRIENSWWFVDARGRAFKIQINR